MNKIMALLVTGIFMMASMFIALPANASDNTFVNGINSARANQGKSQLSVNGDLQRTAQDKANRMARANSLTADGYSDAWKGGSQAVAADPAARSSELLRNDFLGKQSGTTLNGSYGIIGVGEAVSSNGTLFVAINVAPAPYVPSTGGGTDSGNTGNGNNNGNGGGSTADNAAAVAAAEARVREEVAEAQRVAEAKAKTAAEAEAKKQAEAKKVAEAEAAKKAEADKKAEEQRLAEEAEQKRIEQEAVEAKAAEAEARIAEAEEKVRVEAEAKKKAEADIIKKNQDEKERFEILLTSLRVLVGISILSAIGSVIVMFRSKPVIPRSFESVTGMEEPPVEQGLVFFEDDEDEYLSPSAVTLNDEKTNDVSPPVKGNLSLPDIKGKN